MEEKLTQHDTRLSLHDEQLAQLSARIALLEGLNQRTHAISFDFRKPLARVPPKTGLTSPKRFDGDILSENRQLLQEILSDSSLRQEFANFCHKENKDSLLEAWRALSAYEEVPKGKQTNSVMLSSIAQSTWDAVNQTVIFPSEVTNTIDLKITTNNYSPSLFAPAKEYIFNVMVLFVVPSFLKLRSDVSPGTVELVKHRQAKTGKVKESSGKTKKKVKIVKSLGSSDERTKNLIQQGEVVQSTISNMMQSLTRLSLYLEERQNKLKTNGDDIAMAEMAKLLPELNNILLRQQKVFHSKIAKLKIIPTEMSKKPVLNEASTLRDKDLGPSQLPPTVRRSSVIAERLWAELNLDNKLEKPNPLPSLPEINTEGSQLNRQRSLPGKMVWRQTVPCKPESESQRANHTRAHPRVRSVVVTNFDVKEFAEKKDSFVKDSTKNLEIGKILEKENDKESELISRTNRTVDDMLEDILQDSKDNFPADSSGEEEMEDPFEGDAFLEELDDEDFQDLLGQIMVVEGDMRGCDRMKERLKKIQDQYADLLSDMEVNLSSDTGNLDVMLSSITSTYDVTNIK